MDFLKADGGQGPSRIVSCFEVEGARKDETTEWSDLRIWDDIGLIPDSVESEFCILPSDESRKQPILEALATDLLDSIEGLAEEEVKIQQSRHGQGHLRLFIFPIIVTNAELVVCSFKSSAVKIVDGTLDPDEATLEPVPFIRFRKSLATKFPDGSFYSLRETCRARERTVIVCNANSLPLLLKQWSIYPINTYAIQRLAADL